MGLVIFLIISLVVLVCVLYYMEIKSTRREHTIHYNREPEKQHYCNAEWCRKCVNGICTVTDLQINRDGKCICAELRRINKRA